MAERDGNGTVGRHGLRKAGGRLSSDLGELGKAVEFCKRLSSREGVEYRLPTEAEWEYAWYAANTSDVDEKYAHRVGQKLPNPWGLYNMHGNVYEWCSDWYDEDYYSDSPSIDPQGPKSGLFRVIRGEGWGGESWSCRSTARYKSAPSSIAGRHEALGFRVLRNSVSE